MTTKNTKQERLPQAPRTPLPELAEFLAPLRVHFTQGPSAETLRQYLTGLLSEHPNKNCDTLAEVVPETTGQQFHHLLTDMVWDETALNRQRIDQMRTLPSEGDGVLIFDDTGFEKQGRHSVGVARQYTGTAGKLTNCQVTVNCHYAERPLAWPVATRLYLPQAWAEDAARRTQAHVPEAVRFQTKAEIALALLDEANRCGVGHACVTCDADYGDTPHVLNGLEDRQERQRPSKTWGGFLSGENRPDHWYSLDRRITPHEVRGATRRLWRGWARGNEAGGCGAGEGLSAGRTAGVDSRRSQAAPQGAPAPSAGTADHSLSGCTGALPGLRPGTPSQGTDDPHLTYSLWHGGPCQSPPLSLPVPDPHPDDVLPTAYAPSRAPHSRIALPGSEVGLVDLL